MGGLCSSRLIYTDKLSSYWNTTVQLDCFFSGQTISEPTLHLIASPRKKPKEKLTLPIDREQFQMNFVKTSRAQN